LKGVHPPTKIRLDERGKELVLSKLIRIDEYPEIIISHGLSTSYRFGFLGSSTVHSRNYLNDDGFKQSVSMKQEILELSQYLFSVNESPSYLNDVFDDVTDILNFLTKEIGLKEIISNMRSRDHILSKKERVLREKLPEKTAILVSEISRRYGLTDYINTYRMGKFLPRPGFLTQQKETHSTQPNYQAGRHREGPTEPKQQSNIYSTQPKSADRVDLKMFESDLMKIWFEKDYAAGGELKDVFEKHYRKAMQSGLDREIKEYLKKLKEDDIDLLSRDDGVRKGDLIYKKMAILVEKLHPYSG